MLEPDRPLHLVPVVEVPILTGLPRNGRGAELGDFVFRQRELESVVGIHREPPLLDVVVGRFETKVVKGHQVAYHESRRPRHAGDTVHEHAPTQVLDTLEKGRGLLKITGNVHIFAVCSICRSAAAPLLQRKRCGGVCGRQCFLSAHRWGTTRSDRQRDATRKKKKRAMAMAGLFRETRPAIAGKMHTQI